MVYYAQLNENNICFCVACLSGEMTEPNFVKLDFYDTSVLGKEYVNGEWVEVPVPPTPTEPTQLDNIESYQLILMEAMAEQYEEGLRRDLNNMETQATIYEAILELGGIE